MERTIAPGKSELGAQHLEIVLDETARGVQSHYVPVTDEEKALNKRVNRKLDCFVLSLLALEFTFCGIDKTNIGFVATSSFPKDVHLGADAFPHSISLFSATYVVLQPVMVILARRVGVKYFLAVQLVTWGGLCMCHTAIRSAGTLIALRLLLGAAEAGFTQIGNYYMSTVYPKAELAWRVGLFSSMYSLAGAFAGLLAYALLQLETPHLHGWQAVFLLEGGFTVLLGLLTPLALPRRLGTAWFLTAPERAHALYRMEVDLSGTQESADDEDAHGTGTVTRRDLADVLTDWKKLATVLCNVTSVLPGMGYYAGPDATPMSAPPFLAGVASLLLLVRSSDRVRERSLHTVAGRLLGVVDCIVMAVSDRDALRYGFCYVCMAGVFVGGPLLAVWLAGNTPWKGARGVVLGVNGWSNVAGVIAGQIFKDKYAPRCEAAEIATWDEQRFADESTSQVRRGDQRHTFRYGL
ncbi:MFS general substrate transporter [Apiospora phragmitis]|uniref:MFS general substrate transporter n=1 Tax=Apiospora phragmitis TaxID=2905665 RepID=A0ABR1TB03_9PEZI